MSRVKLSNLRWAALILAAAIPLNATVGSAQSASAATYLAVLAATACRHSNQVSANASIGSQVDGDLVTICLSKSLLKKLTPKPAPKPTPKQSLRVRPIPVAKPTPKPTRVVAAPVKEVPIKKPPVKAKPKPKPKTLASNRGNRGVFRPTVDALAVSPLNLKVGGSAKISSYQKTRLGRTKLLGSPVAVRFTPTALSFRTGDGSTFDELASEAKLSHQYLAPGRYSVQLTVTYRVEYQLASGKWFRDPDTIQLSANPVDLTVGNPPASNTLGNIVLVTP
jgi:hypothetical protein